MDPFHSKYFPVDAVFNLNNLISLLFCLEDYDTFSLLYSDPQYKNEIKSCNEEHGILYDVKDCKSLSEVIAKRKFEILVTFLKLGHFIKPEDYRPLRRKIAHLSGSHYCDRMRAPCIRKQDKCAICLEKQTRFLKKPFSKCNHSIICMECAKLFTGDSKCPYRCKGSYFNYLKHGNHIYKKGRRLVCCDDCGMVLCSKCGKAAHYFSSCEHPALDAVDSIGRYINKIDAEDPIQAFVKRRLEYFYCTKREVVRWLLKNDSTDVIKIACFLNEIAPEDLKIKNLIKYLLEMQHQVMIFTPDNSYVVDEIHFSVPGITLFPFAYPNLQFIVPSAKLFSLAIEFDPDVIHVPLPGICSLSAKLLKFMMKRPL
ncbi:hypothetical protein GAYE_PCTG52G1270 [Galdieria yellowstonensis]|uniref:RING-type domain-containing protein n=1 Tax=Galdieria yellowstonensis TaxID=3028027 RepID=A0AAV9I458_9RHOD|nr:hypothetical protein GAYE_PCTG52G1270 [Galdieria yellowstonensis]